MLTSSDFLTLSCIMLLGQGQKYRNSFSVSLFGRSTKDFLLSVLQKLT